VSSEQTIKDNKQLVREIFDAWSRGDIRPLVAAMTEDFQWIFPGSWSWSGIWEPKRVVVEDLLRGEIGSQLTGSFESRPDFVLADEDRVVVQTRGSGMTIRGDAYNNTYCLIFRLRDGQLSEVIEHCDTSLVDCVLTPPRRPL
jgi:hypothetical protein